MKQRNATNPVWIDVLFVINVLFYGMVVDLYIDSSWHVYILAILLGVAMSEAVVKASCEGGRERRKLVCFLRSFLVFLTSWVVIVYLANSYCG